MMLKEKSKPRKQLKYLIVLPLAAVAVVLFARPNVLDVNDSLQDNMIVDTLYQHFDKIPVQKSYAESDTVQILKLDPTFALPVGFAGWSMSTTNSDGPSPCNRKAAFMKEKGGMIRLSSTIPWDKEDLEQFADEAKASMLKSLNEIYGKKEKKQNISGFTTSSSVTTSQFSAASYGVKDFFQIYCKEGEGIGYDGQLILLDGKEISYQQLQKQSIDDLVGAHEVYPSSTNLKKVFGKQAKKGVWVLVSKKNPSYWDEFCKKLQ